MADFFCLEEVSFAYPQHGRGLSPLSMKIKPGEAVWIGGASGCGKSTLARCLTGLIPHLYHGHLSGIVWLEGSPTRQMPLWETTRKVGLVFQNPATQMLAYSVEEEIIFGLENLGLPAAEIRNRVDAALETFELAPLRHRPPQTLSGGEQQKLALACMLARQTPALVLDEPLSMLDPTAAADFVALIEREIAEGRTVVFCEHRHEYLTPLSTLRTVHLNHLSSPLEIPAGVYPHDPPESANTGESFALQANRLSVIRGGRLVLQDLDFSLPAGEIVAVVGRNGAGKTTLLRSIAGLQPFDGQLSVASPAGQQPPAFGLVFQNPDLQLFKGTVREEILFRIPHPVPGIYNELLADLGLECYEDIPPLLLSEGEKRRVALATVLMRQPAHGVLLDEPSLGQDTHHKTVLMHTLRGVAGSGKLAIIATHDLDLAFQADRLILLGGGRILAQGTPAEVLLEPSAWEQSGIRIPTWVRRPL